MFTGNSPKIQEPEILVFSNLSYTDGEEKIIQLLTEEELKISIVSNAQDIYGKYSTNQLGKLLILDDRVPNDKDKVQIFSKMLQELDQILSESSQKLLDAKLFTSGQATSHAEYLDCIDEVASLEDARKMVIDKFIDSNNASKTLRMLGELNYLVPLIKIDDLMVFSNLHFDAVKLYQAFLPRALIFDSSDSLKFVANVLPKLIMPDHSQS